MRKFYPRVIVFLLSILFYLLTSTAFAQGRIGLNSSYYSGSSPELYPCDTNFIYIELDNDLLSPTPVFPLVVTVRINTSYRTLSLSDLHRSAGVDSLTWTYLDSTAAGVRYVIHSSHLADTFKTGQSITAKLNIYTNCEILSHTSSISSTFLTDTFSLQLHDSLGASLAYHYEIPFNVYFPVFTISYAGTSPDSMLPAGITTYTSPTYVAASGPGDCPTTIFSDLPPDRIVYRRVKISNIGRRLLHLENGLNHPTRLLIKDLTLDTARIKVIGILDASGAPVPITVQRVGYVDQFSIGDTLLGILKWPAVGMPEPDFDINDEIIYYEKIILKGNICSAGITSYISTEWNCNHDSTTCSESTTYCSTFNLPGTTANLLTIRSANRNYCYDGDSSTYKMIVKNIGNNRAGNIRFSFDELHASNLTQYFMENAMVDGIYIDTSFVTSGFSSGRKTFTIIPDSLHQLELDPGDSLILTWKAVTLYPEGDTCSTSIMDDWRYYLYYSGRCDGVGVTGTNVFAPRIMGGGSITLPTIDALIGDNDNTYLPPVWPQIARFALGEIDTTTYWSRTPDLSNRHYVCHITLSPDINVYSGDTASTPHSSTHLADHIRFYRMRSGVRDALPTAPSFITYLPDPIGPMAPTYGRNDGDDDIIAVFNNPGLSGLAFDSIFNQMVIEIDVQPHCPNTGSNFIRLKMNMVPDDTCEDLTLNTGVIPQTQIPVFCGEKSIQVQCPGCIITGLYNDVMWLSRLTYGYRDAGARVPSRPPNHVPDNLTPIVFDDSTMTVDYPSADTRKMLYYDAFKTRLATHVELNEDFFPVADDLPNIKTSNYSALAGVKGFEYAYLRMRMNGECFDSINPITGMDDSLPACIVRIFAPSPDSFLFDNFFHFSSDPIILPFNIGWGDRIDPVTHEFIYNFSMERLHTEWDSVHTTPGDTLPFDIFYNQMQIYIDCNYWVTGNVGTTSPDGIECEMIASAYFTLKPENTAVPADWTVEMQHDTIFGFIDEMASLCDSVTLHPRTEDLISSYDADGANTIIDSCIDVRWYCVNPSSTFQIYGFEWHNAHNYLKKVSPCYLTFYNTFTSTIATNNTSGIVYINNPHPQQIYPVEYRNLYLPKTIELRGMRTGLRFQTPTMWYDYLVGYRSHPLNITSHTVTGDTTDILKIPVASLSSFTDLTGYGNDVFRPDDGMRLAYNLKWLKPCSQDTLRMTLIEVDSFPNNHFSSQIDNRYDSLYGRHPETADTLGNDRYFAFPFKIAPVSSYIRYHIETGIAAGGHVTWTVRIDSAYEFENPWVGFTGMEDFALDSVRYFTDLSDLTPDYFNYRPDLDSGLCGADSTPYADTVIVMNGKRNLTGLNINGVNRILKIYAAYDCDSIPCDSFLCSPHFYLGNICDTGLLHTLRNVQHGLTLDSLMDMSCLEKDTMMPFVFFRPILNIDEPDTSSFADDTLCGEAVFDFDITNSGQWYLCNNFVYINIPPASGYVFSPPVAEVTYNGVMQSVTMTAVGTDSLLLDMTGLTNLPLMNGSTTVRGIPDPAHQDLTHPGTLHIRFTLNTGCQFSYDEGDFLKFDFYGDDGCSKTTIHNHYTYNPILLNRNSEYNRFSTTVDAPSPFNRECELSNMVTLSFQNEIDNPYGAQHTGHYNVVHMHLSPCYYLDSIHVHYPSGVDSLIGYEGSDSGLYRIPVPPGIHIDSMPEMHAWFRIDANCYCDTFLTAAMYTERSLVCHDTGCNLFEPQQDSIIPTLIHLEAPSVTVSTFVDLPAHTLTFSGTDICTPVWTIDDTTVATTDSFIHVSSYGSHCVTLSNTLGEYVPCPGDTFEQCFFILPPPPQIGVTSTVSCQSSALLLSNTPEIYTVPDTICLKICAFSCVRYYALTGDTLTNPDSFKWTVRGALSVTVLDPTGDSVDICWDSAGYGNIKLEMFLDDSMTGFDELCMEIIERPNAVIWSRQDTFLCLGETLYLIDSSTFSTSSIQTRIWSWGDGSDDETYRMAADPQGHVYDSAGDYRVVLYVVNECGCGDSCIWNIHVESDPIPVILCGGAACYGDTVRYSTTDTCSPYGWDVVGGTIIGTSGQSVFIVWDDPDVAYGYVLLDGASCTGVCSDTAMLRIPIIQSSFPIEVRGELCGLSTILCHVPYIPGTAYDWVVTGATQVDADYTNEVWVIIEAGNTATIDVTYTNFLTGGMCTGSSTLTVTSGDIMTWDAERNMCVGSMESIGLVNSTATTEWEAVAPDGSILSHTGTSDWSFTFTQTGDYLFTATDTAGCPPDELIVHVHALPAEVDTIMGADTVCAGDPNEYSVATPVSGAQAGWLVIGGSPVSGSGEVISVRWTIGAPVWQIGCYVTGAESPYCSSDTVWKNVYPLNPNLNVEGDSIVCENSYESYHQIYEGSDYYRWTISASTSGSVRSGDGSQDIEVLWNNVDVVTHAALICEMRICGTVYFDTLNIIINPTLDPEVTVGHVCPGQATLLTCSTADGYEWSSSVATILGRSTDDEAFFVFENDGLTPISINVSVWVTNPGGCPGLRRIDTAILVPPNPGFTLSLDEFCDDNFATITATPSLVGAVYTFYDVSGATIPSAVNLADINSAGVYTCLIDYDGCTYTAGIGVDCPVGGGGCLMPASGTLVEDCGEITATGSPADPLYCTDTPTYSWLLMETGELQNTQNAVFNVHRAGIYHLRYGISCDGCENWDVETIEVPLIADFDIDIDCRDITNLNTSTWLTIAPAHLWTLPILGGSVLEAPAYTLTGYDAGGVYNAFYTLSDGTHFCRASKSITIPPLPVADFSFTDGRCEGTPVSFTDLSSGSIRNWFWDFNDVATVDGIRNPERVYSVPSTYRVNLTVTDNVGCIDDMQHDVNIVTNALIGGGVISPDNSVVCDGTPVPLSYLVTGGFGSPTIYHWSTGDITPTTTVLRTGAYLVTVSDASGCIFDGADKALVEIIYGSPAVISGEASYCVGEDVLLHSINTADSYLWKEGGTTKSTTRDMDLTGVTVGSHTYTLTTTESGCTSIATFVIHMWANPTMTGPSYVVNSCSPYEATLTATSASTGGLLWSNGSSGSPITVNSSGFYEATLTDINGCSVSHHITLPDPPTALEFPEGCLTICDTLLPMTIPMGREYDSWTLYKDDVVIDASWGVPTFVIDGAGSYRMDLEIDGCSISTGTVDVEIEECTPCECKLDSIRIDTMKISLPDTCKYKFWNRSIPNHCYQIDSTVWGEYPHLGRLGVGDSFTYSFPMNGLYNMVAKTYLRNHATGENCIIRDTIFVFLGNCIPCGCTFTPHLKYTNISINPCCVKIEDTTAYLPCQHVVRWQWRINLGTPYLTYVPYTTVCDDGVGPVDSINVDTRFWADNIGTVNITNDTCVIMKTDYRNIYPCNSGRLRRGGFSYNESSENELTAFPIPFSDILNIKFHSKVNESTLFFIKIYDMEGKIVYLDRQIFTEELLTLDLRILADGVYEMQAIDEIGNHYRVKLVKSR